MSPLFWIAMENFDNRNTKDPQTRRDSRTENLTKQNPATKYQCRKELKKTPKGLCVKDVNQLVDFHAFNNHRQCSLPSASKIWTHI